MASATNSPSLDAMYRRRPSFDRPPIRAINSPRLTAEEADQLTSPFLNYSTNYTYAFSQAYNPDRPPAWEVPNMINNNVLHISSPEYVQSYSAPSVLRKASYAVSDAVWIAISSVLWLLHAITVRPLRAIGAFMYYIIELLLYALRRLGESVSALMYRRRVARVDRAYSHTSTLEMLSMMMYKFVSFLGYVICVPGYLVYGAFQSLKRALTQNYYSLLMERNLRVSREIMMKRLHDLGEDLTSTSTSTTAYDEENDGDIDIDDGEYFRRTPSGYNSGHHVRYNLRSRNIVADTDTEDDTPRVVRRNVRFDMSSQAGQREPPVRRPREVSMSYRIATWLGFTASSMVYYLQNGLNGCISLARKPFEFAAQKCSYIFPGGASPSGIQGSPAYLRSGARYSFRDSARSSYKTENEKKLITAGSTSAAVTPFVSNVVSTAASVLYAPCRALLFVAFACADLMRWFWSRVPDVVFWFRGMAAKAGGSIFNRRRRWLLWLLPIFLLLLLLWFPRSHDDHVVILGHDVSEMKDQISNYAYSIVDSGGVYAKSLNSIYDEYWRSGSVSPLYGWLSKATSALRNGCLSIVSVFKSVVNAAYAWVEDLLSYIANYPLGSGRETFVRLPSVSSLKSSVTGVLSYTEKHISNGLTSLSTMGSSVLEGLRCWWYLIWNGIVTVFLAISKVFERPHFAVIEQQSPEKSMESSQAVYSQEHTQVKPAVVYAPSPSPTIDEAKLVDKVSAEVREKMEKDLKVKLETEMQAFAATFNEKISNLKVEKNRVDVDYAHLESLIRTAIYEYDSDKTGMFDFALESAGASIISTRCSENYNTYSRLEKIWNIPLWYSSYGPRTVIQRNSKTLFPGECWSFKGPVGYITIGLSHPINVTIISYEHIGAHQAPGGERPSAPKTFKIWAYKTESDLATRVLLGDFVYDINGSPLQFFVVKSQPDYPVKIIEMEVTSNYGAEYTSLYRLRVHGSLYKPGGR